MGTDVFIRPAQVQDAEQIQRVYHDAYQENLALGFPASAASVTKAEVEHWIQDAHMFVAVWNDEIVGAVRLMVHPEWKLLVLSRLGVSSRWKGHGIASKLMAVAEDTALSMGWRSLRLTTPVNHPYLPDMYRRRGYKDVGIREFDDLPYDEVILEKPL